MGSAIITITIIIIIIIIHIITPSTPHSFGWAHTLHTAQLHVAIQSLTVRPTEERLWYTVPSLKPQLTILTTLLGIFHTRPQQTIKLYKKICRHNRPPKQRWTKDVQT